MADLNWHNKILRYRGAFLHEDDLEGQSHVHRLLSGAEKWDSSDVEEGMPIYDEQIAEMGRQWDAAREEELRQQKDVQDLNQKVAGVREAKLWVAKFKRPVPYPCYSHWSKTQQRFVVDMMLRYWATGVPANPPPAEAQDVQKLVGFIEEMRQEQDEFFRFTREVNATQLGRYNFTHAPIRRYMEKIMRTKLKRVREYQSHYKQISMLPLAPPAGEPPNFSHLGEPLELGEVPVCVIPNMTHYTDLKKQCVFLEQFFPSSQCYPKSRIDGWKPRDGTYLYKDPVSADPNVARLAPALDFRFVATPSVLKTLLDNGAPWERQWDVPVTVRDVACREPGRTRRLVFLDKPLPPRSLTNMERNARAHKRTVRVLVCKRRPDGPVDYGIQPQQARRLLKPSKKSAKTKKGKGKQQSQPSPSLEEGEDEEEEDESIASPACPSSESTAGAQPADVGSGDDMSIDSDDEQLRIDCEDPELEPEPEPEPKPEPEPEPEPETDMEPDGPARSVEGQTEESALAREGGAGQPAAAAAAESGPGPETRRGDNADPAFLRPPPGLNVEYRVWQLGRHQLLLRTATHGMRDNPLVGLIRYTVHAKPAYQPGYGVEKMSRAEVIRQWLDCRVRPDSRVLRVHLDPVSLIVITPEERTLKQLTDELIKYDTGFRPQYGLQVLESLLRELGDLEPGQYLLSHDARAGAFARLARADAGPGGTDMHSSFPDVPREVRLSAPPSISIDPSVLTPYNITYGRVPATFDYNMRPAAGEAGWKEYWAKMKEIGKTRKKKKTGDKAKKQSDKSREEKNKRKNKKPRQSEETT